MRNRGHGVTGTRSYSLFRIPYSFKGGRDIERAIIGNYTLRVSLPVCNRALTTLNVTADLGEDISAVFPYVNAVARRARYNLQAGAISFAHEERTIVLWPRQILFGGVEDEGEARQVLAGVVALLNRLWQERATIVPSYRAVRNPRPLDLYRLLPAHNCRACGQPTCMAFVARLLREEVAVTACTPLFAPEGEASRRQVLALLREAGRIVPED